MIKRFALVGIAVLGFSLNSFAQDKPAATKPAATKPGPNKQNEVAPEMLPDEPKGGFIGVKGKPKAWEEKLSTTEHELKAGDQVLRYRARAGTMPLPDEAGKPRANFFFVAYEKAGEVDLDKRPITFVFNGGPGAAAIWLHLGTAGPKRIELTEEGYPKTPPYKLTDNATTWLHKSDLVFIDPVGTGFSRAAEGIKGEEFFGVQQDIDSVSDFIRLYLSRGHRWASPKFVAGESYGTTRAALLSEHLLDRHGIALNGVILISTVLSFQTLHANDANELPYALFLPTYTACAFYHKRLATDLSDDLEKTLAESKQWVSDVYIPALAKGDALAGEERKRVAASMARYTGLSEPFIERARLRVSPSVFEKQLLLGDGKTLGRFDGRIIGNATDLVRPTPEYDPSLTLYVGVYSGTFNDYVRRGLKYESDLQYEYLSGRVHPWNWGRDANGGWLYVGDSLRDAVTKHPALKVLVCSGYYDLATPFFATDYTINHLGLAEGLRKNVRHTYYEGGHMMYHHSPSLEKLNKDVAGFMDWAVSGK